MSRVICSSRFGTYPGLSVDPGYASSYDGRDGHMAYRYWIQTPGVGWTRYPWSRWYRTPALGGIFIGGQDHFGLRAGGAAWARVVVQKYWHYADRDYHSEYIYPAVESNLGGFTYPGGWCWWSD